MEAGSNAAHSELVNDTLIKIGALPYVRVFKRIVGLFYRVRFNSMGKVVNAEPVTVGVKGEPDIDGILTRWDGAGIRLGLECKTGNAVQSKEQKNYQAMIEAMGGIYLKINTPEQALTLVQLERERGRPLT